MVARFQRAISKINRRFRAWFICLLEHAVMHGGTLAACYQPVKQTGAFAPGLLISAMLEHVMHATDAW